MSKRTDCIARLLSINSAYFEICNWLIEQKLTNATEVNTKIREQERAEFIHFILIEAVKNDKMQLVDYEWTILPLEQIRITCVTEREKKEFTYGH